MVQERHYERDFLDHKFSRIFPRIAVRILVMSFLAISECEVRNYGQSMGLLPWRS